MFFENIYDTCSCHLAKPLTKICTDSSPHPAITWEGVRNFYSLQQVKSQEFSNSETDHFASDWQ